MNIYIKMNDAGNLPYAHATNMTKLPNQPNNLKSPNLVPLVPKLGSSK